MATVYLDLQGTNHLEMRTRAGQVIDCTFNIVDNPFNLETADLSMTVYRGVYDGPELLSLTKPDGIEIVGTDAFKIKAAAPTFNRYKGPAYYRIIIDIDGEKRALVEGPIQIL